MAQWVSRTRLKVASLATAVILVFLLVCTSQSATAAKDDLPDPRWGRSCQSSYSSCATVEVYRHWDEKKHERLNFKVDALMDDPNKKGVTTVWLLMDDPNLEFAKDIKREGINVVIVHPRGTEKSSTFFTCTKEKAPHDAQCWLTEKCVDELATASAEKDGFWNASYFSADQVVHDLNWVIRKLGDGRPNVLMAQGLSSMLALRLLQMHQDLNVGVILFDYVNPLWFDTYGYLGGAGHDVALERLLSQCDDQVTCVGRLGASEGALTRLHKLLSLAENKKLACASQLKWGTGKLWGASFADQFRSVLALMMRFPAYPFVAGNKDLMSLIPSMLYRLQRCGKEDVKALNTLYDYLSGAKESICPKDVAIQMHWLVNDFVQEAAPKNIDKYWSNQASSHMLLPTATNMKAFARAAAKFPAVARSAASWVLPENATQKILLISSDVDVLSPRGTTGNVAIAFKKLGESVTVLQLSGLASSPASYLAPCLIENLKAFQSRNEWAAADQCKVNPAFQIDFTTGPSKEFYGVEDAWSYDGPNKDDGSSSNGGRDQKGGSSAVKTFFKVLLWLILLAAVGAGGFFGYQYMKARGFRYNRISDNFYDNLHS